MDFMAIIDKRASDKSREWLSKTREKCLNDFSKDDFLISFTRANKMLGKKTVDWDAEEQENLQKIDPEIHFASWSLGEMGRVQLLLTITHLPAEEYLQLVEHCYSCGDVSEQCAILKSLALLPDPKRFISIALEAVRTNVMTILGALICHNPFPYRYFNNNQYNNIVLKSVFMGLPLAAVVGLHKRINEELARMANEYIDEREAAGRNFPYELWSIIGPFAEDKSLERMNRYLNHEDPQHRYWVVTGLMLSGCSQHLEALQKALTNETNEQVKLTIEQAIDNIN